MDSSSSDSNAGAPGTRPSRPTSRSVPRRDRQPANSKPAGPSPKLPAHPGERVRITIEDLTSRGWGVGRTAAGLVVMVPLTVPGDEVEAQVTTVRPSHAEAEIVSVVEASPDRGEPFCTHFGTCGGCALQQMPVEAQRRAKTERLRRLLKKLAGLPEEIVTEAVQVGPDTGFRNRMEFAVAPAPDGAWLGLHDNSGKVFDLSECHLPHPDVVRMALRVRAAIREHDLPVADGRVEVPGLSRIDIRRASGGEILVALRAEGDLPAAALAPLAALVEEPDGPAGMVLTAVRPAPAESSSRQRTDRGRPSRRGARQPQPEAPRPTTRRQVLAGRGELEEKMLGLRIPFTEESFIQTHTAGAAALYKTALAWIADEPAAPCLDLYAGLGLLAQAAAATRSTTVAIESVRAAVEAGRRSAGLNRRRVHFEHDQAHRAVRRLATKGRQFPMVIANPPRAGLHRAIPKGLQELGVRRLAYISCDPATLGRDLARFGRAGMAVRRIEPFDLFPHTAGLEAVALLEAVDEPAAGL